MQIEKPKVTMIAAMSLDGRIATRQDQSSYEWTSPEDKEHFARVTKQAGVVVMGRRTFETFDSQLAGRRLIVLTAEPERYKDRMILGVLEFTDEDPTDLVERLENEAVEEIVVAGGTSVYSQFMQADLVDELVITIEPKIFGSGVSFVESDDGDVLAEIELELRSVNRLGRTSLVLHYSII